MKTRILLFAAIMLLAGLMVPSKTWAAEFSPVLDHQLSAKAPTEFVSAIIILESPIDIRALDERLHIQQASRAERYRQVVEALHYNANMTQPAIRAELEEAKSAGRVLGYTAYWIENLFVVKATREFLETMRPRSDVKFVTENFRPELIEPQRGTSKWDSNQRNPLDTRLVPPGIVAVGALRVAEELGITGMGVLVGNCDTGVDGNHPALASRWRGNFAPWYHCWMDNLGTNTTFPNDGYGHGTHVMGTITGRAISGSDTTWIGCAPNARWIANNAINQGVSSEFDNDIIRSYQWFANPDSNINTLDDVPDVIQNSWGVFTGLGYPQCFDFWNTVITNCEAAGVVVTWSAGNESTSGLRSPAIYQLNNYQIYSVGAVDATNYSWPYPLASFSSQGPTPCQPNPGAIKPEISAPGVDVYSAYPGGSYTNMSGTSMAGPHVAGVVALMREACPNCDPQTIKAAIMNTARDLGPAGEDNQFGAGFIDAYAAVLAVSNLGHLVGTVTDAFSNPISGALVKNANGLQQTLTNANGQYDLPLSEGTYTIEYSKFGYVTQSVSGVVIVEGQNTTQNVSLQLAPQGTVSGIVTNCFGNPAFPATVTVLNTPVPPANTNVSGFYSITLPQGTYDMRASGAGCGSHTVNGVVVGVNTTQNFTLPVDPRYECSAPDAAGYIACEDGDLNGPTYAWFEVSPNAGGPGTNTGVYGDDTGTNVTIPFTFRLYGQNYTSVWMCTNGFLSFSTTSSSYGNQSLPNSSIGYAICPFWDDLYVVNGTGDMSYYYLAAENAFILEWRNVGHYGNQSQLETFQVWLYNVATNPSPTGDSQIKIQYQDVTEVSSNTVGVQSGTIANQYVFNNTLDPNAQGLVDNRAICYGGCNPPIVGTLQGTITDCFGNPAANATVSFPGSFYPPIQANGAGFYTVNVVPGTYDVRADKLPCTYTRSNGHVVQANQTTTVNLTLRAPTRIVGTITNCTGGPAVGAIVSFPGSSVSDTITNASGQYQRLVDAGTYNVNARNNTCSAVQSNNNVVAEAQTVTVNLTLAAPGILQGTVTSCQGGPAVGATVTLSGGPVTPPPAQTNGVGFYQFTQLPAGNYSVLVTFGGCAPGNANVVVSSGQTTTQNFTLVSDPRALCSAPDGYGYYACENLDGGGPVYNWLGIHPNEGGSGSIINQSCDDCFTQITLPFPVQFYGVNYTTAYVGSNGYLTFSAGATSYSNICLPASYMPAGIYPFWDDLYTACASADVVSYFDATNHWFVVEWYQTCHCCSEGNYENFQIILYDQAFYPTATGDNDIVCQYNSMSLLTSNTVGIQSLNGSNYLLYVCNNVLQGHAFGLAQGRAIKFTTGPGCNGVPDIAVNPSSVVGQAPLGGTDTEIIQICNVGVCPLRYTVDFDQITPALALSTSIENLTITMSKEEISWLEAINRGEKPGPLSTDSERRSLDNQGGPDAYGYRWIDSNEPGGPTFNWVEINSIGTNTGITGDDQVASFTLPWTFNFYGVDYTTIRISSNGNVHFGTANAAYYNDDCDLPNPTSGPLAMIAPFWDDLYPPSGGIIYYYNDVANSRYIVEWDQIWHIGGTPQDVYTFQVILYQNGRILLQYLNLGTGGNYGVTSCFVGIQNESGTVALQVVCDQPYLTNNLAIQIQAATQWMSLQGALTGSLDPGQCANITLNFSAQDLPQGSYSGVLTIDTNDPDEDPVTVPVTFNVGSLDPPTNLTVYYLPTTNQLEFRWVASPGAASYTILSSTSPDGPFSNVVATTPNTVHQIPFPGATKLWYVVVANGN